MRTRKKLRKPTIRKFLWLVPAYVGILVLLHVNEALADIDLRFLLLVLIPSIVLTVVLAWPLIRKKRIALTGGWINFIIAYLVCISLLSEMQFLVGSRIEITGTEITPPVRIFGLDFIEDWHFAFSKKSDLEHDAIVVRTWSDNSGTVDLSELRNCFMGLISKSIRDSAKLVVLDYALIDTSAEVANLVYWLNQASTNRIPVCLCQPIAYNESEERIITRPIFPLIKNAIDSHNIAHCAFYLQADRKIRMAPKRLSVLDNNVETELLAMSSRVQQLTDPGFDNPDSELIFIKDFADPIENHVTNCQSLDSTLPSFRDKLVFIGSDREKDKWLTPFGRKSGVYIHSMFASAPLSGNEITYFDRKWKLLLIIIPCLIQLFIQGGRMTKNPINLIAGASGLTFALFVLAALAMYFTNTWIDIAIPVLSLWLITALLWGGARVKASLHRENVDALVIFDSVEGALVNDALTIQLTISGVHWSKFEIDSSTPPGVNEKLKSAIKGSNNLVLAFDASNTAAQSIQDTLALNLPADFDKRKRVIGVAINSLNEEVAFPRLVTSKYVLFKSEEDTDRKLKSLAWDLMGSKPIPLRAFVSYAREDKPHKMRLQVAMSGLNRSGTLDLWSDSLIRAGELWRKILVRELRNSDVFLILISPHCLASDFIFNVEFPIAKELQKQGKMTIIPIIHTAADWKFAGLNEFNVLPSDALPIADWESTDNAWLDVVNGIKLAIGDIRTQQKARELKWP